ncbi:S8 family serine peptidase [Neobacillus sp. OS1-2]|uniref:S8 family peptidase n=1 Tax=Neobacillus sp. OS1-2 TaxID=3070680 RepID=UPI0027E0AC6A|nr:S8 family serine peptidase [Neobacillus sp. OS1-2]WML38176.1 S8 family serine peptidase [Neobacillus sp. OS1-2]
MKILAPILIIAFILSLFLHKYLDLGKYPFVKKISIGLICTLLIGALAIVFTNISFGKENVGWHVKYMDYDRMHMYSTGKSQKIALIDSGVSDFQISNKYDNSIALVGSEQDNNGHGTMMFSILKGYDEEIIGISPDAEVISIKVMDSEEKINPVTMVKAIEEAIKLKSTVINISIGSHKFNQEISDVIDVALNQGITVVASSGDYSNGDMMFPANKPGVISVGSLSANGSVSDFTNAPNDTTINAPGDEIKIILPNKKVESNSGTSQSTVIISGYVSLLKDYAAQEKIKLPNEKIIELLSKINNKKTNYAKAFSSLHN